MNTDSNVSVSTKEKAEYKEDAANGVDGDDFSHDWPVMLLPVRLETRFLGDDLCIRFYPDQIFVDTHQTDLSPEEETAGKKFHDTYLSDDPDAEKQDAWRTLVRDFGQLRAAWIFHVFEENNAFSVRNAARPLLPTPKLRWLPERFFVYLYYRDTDENEQLLTSPFRGKKIVSDLEIVNLSSNGQPLEDDATSTADPFSGEASWMVNFEEAETKGMAIRINLPNYDTLNPRREFSRVIVVGKKQAIAQAKTGDSNNEKDGDPDKNGNTKSGAELLSEIIESHHYSTGIGFVPNGTPTNNTQTSRSGYSESREDREGSYKTEVLLPEGWETVETDLNMPRMNAERLGVALGLMNIDDQEDSTLRSKVLRHLSYAEDRTDDYAKLMQTVLWPATGGYFLRNLADGIVSSDASDYLEKHFTEFVRARGPLPAIRVGDQPYGILPVTSFRSWKPSPNDNQGGDDNAIAFDHRLHTFLVGLLDRWLEWANDPYRVPRVGSSDEPTAELLKILSMEPASIDCKVRPWVDERFIAWLIIELQETLFSPVNERPGYWIQKWAETWRSMRRDNAKFWSDLTGDPPQVPPEEIEMAPFLRLLSWGSAKSLEDSDVWKALVAYDKDGDTEIPSDYLPELCAYLDTLLDGSDDAHGPDQASRTILRDSLIRAIRLIQITSEDQNKQNIRFARLRDAICGQVGDTKSRRLVDLPTVDLETLLRETLDLSSHRLDAWITSFATKRLMAMRNDETGRRASGIYLGAYGWVENLVPSQSAPESWGYIHAPSQARAAAAAVLYNGYRVHGNDPDENPFRINLNSERVRRALHVIDGVRQGQDLGALLGYQFERQLHEMHLDSTIDFFRAEFPPVANKVTAPNVKEKTESMAARNVVDGLELTRWWESQRENLNVSDTMHSELLKLVKNNGILSQVLDGLLNSLDATSDTLLFEGAYQAVQGNFERAGAAIDAASGTAMPPEIESMRTPVSGKAFGHRVCLLFFGEPPQPLATKQNGTGKTPRELAEPRLTAWVDSIFDTPDQILCHYKFQYDDESLDSIDTREESASLSLVDLGLGTLDLLYLSEPNATDGESEIEQRIAYYVRKKYRLEQDVEISIEFDATNSQGLGNALELARRIRRALGRGSPLLADVLYPPSTAHLLPLTPDLVELKGRLDACLGDIQSWKDDLNKTENRDVQLAALEKASLYGILGCLPRSPKEVESNFQDRCERVFTELSKRFDQYQMLIPEDNDLTITPIASDALNNLLNKLIEATRVLFGRNFLILPSLKANKYGENQDPNSQYQQNMQLQDELLQALSQPDLLAGHGEERVRLWLQQAGETHPPLRDLEDVLMFGEVWKQAAKLAANQAVCRLQALQLPFAQNNRWLALSEAEKDSKGELSPEGAVSIVAATWKFDKPRTNLASSVPELPLLSGLLLDQWEETIPDNTVDSSVAFQYTSPNAQAPQTLLLAVPSRRDDISTKWEIDELAEIVKDTMDLMKIRTIDLEAMGESKVEKEGYQAGVGSALPALMFEKGGVSESPFGPVDYPDTIEEWLELLLDKFACADFQKHEVQNDIEEISSDSVPLGSHVTINGICCNMAYLKAKRQEEKDGTVLWKNGTVLWLESPEKTGQIEVALDVTALIIKLTLACTESTVHSPEQFADEGFYQSASDENKRPIEVNCSYRRVIGTKLYINAHVARYPVFELTLKCAGIKYVSLLPKKGLLLDEVCILSAALDECFPTKNDKPLSDKTKVRDTSGGR